MRIGRNYSQRKLQFIGRPVRTCSLSGVLPCSCMVPGKTRDTTSWIYNPVLPCKVSRVRLKDEGKGLVSACLDLRGMCGVGVGYCRLRLQHLAGRVA
jgi:hypothetical protein